MTKKRLLDADPIAKTKTNFLYEESTSGRESDDSIVIEHEQDVTDILKDNKAKANEIDRHQPHGNMSKVASIPMVIFHDLKKKGILDDEKRFKQWLNDPDNRALRTRGGRG